VSALSQVVDDWFLVANADDAETWLPGARVVRDERPERGSIIGLHTALCTATDNHVLVVAWDMPFLSVPLMRRMGDIAYAAPAVIPFGDHGPEPFCAVYIAPLVRKIVEHAIDQGVLRVRDVIEQIPFPVTLPVPLVSEFGDPARLFFNVNTAADLARAEEMARGE
jgi:molybdopterin-guanine dinucleotide biosynthesis protein A